MPSLFKLSFFLLVLGFLSAPFFADAEFSFFGNGSSLSYQIQNTGYQILNFGNFSLKNLDKRIYSLLKNKKSSQTALSVHFGPPPSPQCSDGVDNDVNGFADWPDDWPNCGSADDNKESVPQCNDRIDNDADGGIDFGNGVDLDGDGGIDTPGDAECASLAQEGEGTTECTDGLDNDSDSPDGVYSIDYYSGGIWGTGDTDCSGFDDNYEGPEGLCIPTWRCLQDEPQGGINPSVDVYLDNNPSVSSHALVGNAYGTSDIIYWAVEDSCAAECSSTPNNWWSGTLDGSGDGLGSLAVPFQSPSAVTYSLTCHKLPCESTDDSPRNDFVTITPQWSPRIDEFSGPAQVTAGQSVSLVWRGNDVKSCSASGWDGPSASALQVANSGILGQNQSHSVDVGTISAHTTYTLTCTGFNDVVLPTQEVTVNLITSPTPYFFINSINLIIIGPGSGGRSNKATVGVTPGGGFTGTINLSAANSALTSAGAVLRVEPSSITCNGVSCTNSEFWVETASSLSEGVYDIILTADPVPDGFESKTQTIPLRVRRFVPAFEEI